MYHNNQQLVIIFPTAFFITQHYKDLFYHKLPIKGLQLSSLLKEKYAIESNFLDIRFEDDLNSLIMSNKIQKKKFGEKLLQVLNQKSIHDAQNIIILNDTSYEYLQTILIAKTIRRNFSDKNIIIAGHHATAVPHDFIFRNSPFDFVIVGELEYNFLELFKNTNLQRMVKFKRPQIISCSHLIDVNLLPFPEFQHYLEQYQMGPNYFNFEMSASRGCPFNCHFCRIIKTRPIRNYSFQKFQSNLTKMIKLVLKHNDANPKIIFLDESFNSAQNSRKILNYIIDYKKNTKLRQDFSFSCQTRIEIIHKHPNFIKLFSDANMIVAFGFESANPKLLSIMNKTQQPVKYIEKMKDLITKFKQFENIYMRLNLIHGYPGENQKMFNDTLEFIKKYALDENIQLSPTLFNCDPVTYAYQQRKSYKQQFGTEIKQNWWKSKSDPIINAIPSKPSKDYTKYQLIVDYLNEYQPLLKIFSKKNFQFLTNWIVYYKNWITRF